MKRGDIYLVSLEAPSGRAGKLARPCAVVSPDEMNEHLATVMVVPLSTQSRAAPFHVEISHAGTKGWLLLEQCRAIDKAQAVRKLGTLSPKALGSALKVLQETFAE